MQVFIINVKKFALVFYLLSFFFFFFFSEGSGIILVHRIKGVIGNKMYKIVKQLNMHQILCFGAPSYSIEEYVFCIVQSNRMCIPIIVDEVLDQTSPIFSSTALLIYLTNFSLNNHQI